MGGVAAPKCLRDGCDNTTWYQYCHHHRQPGPGESTAQTSVSSAAPPSPAAPHAVSYANIGELWGDLLGAFPDMGESVHPITVHREVIGTLTAAVDAEVYRRFPELDVEDFGEREKLVQQLREEITGELMPDAISRVTGYEARELSHTSADQFGRSAEDSRYLAAYGLRAEWECARLTSTPILNGVQNYEQFVQAYIPEIVETIDTAFRRNLGAFPEIIRQASGDDPINGDPIAPDLAIIAPAQEPVAPASDADVPISFGREWFEERGYVLNEATNEWWKPEAPQPQSQPHGLLPEPPNRPPQSQPVGFRGQDSGDFQEVPPFGGGLLQKAVDAAKDYITDPDGIHRARRAKARIERARAQEQAARARDIQRRRELEEELLIMRKKRNRGW